MNKSSIFIIGCISFSIIFSILQIAFGENYEPKLTEKEWKEFNLMTLCYAKGAQIDLDMLSINETSLHQWCSERYGGIETPYGEAIK